ncbi:MAG: sigma-70 family RNA polymerase sigma factor [Pirellula sp.]|nr:sigma-70 family RNA polymerase sigma factor [Pirellula sp.]
MNDLELLDQIKLASAGNKVSQNRLSWHYQDLLKGRIVNKMREESLGMLVVDDVLQMVYVKILDNFSGTSFEAIEAFQAWLVKLTDNVIIDAARKASSKKEQAVKQAPAALASDQSVAELFDLVADSLPTASVCLIRAEQFASLKTALAKLPEKYRLVIQMHHLDKQTLEQTAVAMNRTPGSVRGLLREALSHLRQDLGNQYSRVY